MSVQNDCGNFVSLRNQCKNVIVVSVFQRKTAGKHQDGIFNIFPSFFIIHLLSEKVIAFKGTEYLVPRYYNYSQSTEFVRFGVKTWNSGLLIPVYDLSLSAQTHVMSCVLLGRVNVSFTKNQSK